MIDDGPDAHIASNDDASVPEVSDDAASADVATADLASAIPLPEVRTSARSLRRHQHREVRRNRLGIRAAILATLVVLVGATAVVLTSSRRNADPRPSTDAAAKARSVDRHALLLTLAGADGRASTLVGLVPGPRGQGGTVLLIPTGTLTELPGLGPQPLGRALTNGGPQALLSTTQNLLGVTISSIVVLTPDSFAEAVAPAGSLRIDVPARVEEVADDGTVKVLFEAGPRSLKADEVASYLSAAGSGTDLDRLARQQRFWEAWFGALRGRSDSIPAQPPDLRRALQALASGAVQVRLLPVRSFGKTTADGELYEAREAEIRRSIDDIFATDTAPRPRVRILNGTGTLELARKVEQRLTPADVQVTLTGNAGRLNHASTQIIYYDPADRPVAQRIRDALGVGTLIRNRNQTDVVDVTIVVGKDFEA